MASSAVIPSSAIVDEAMASPAVLIPPAGPWAHPQKDAVVKISRPVIPHGCAGVWRISIVAVRTDGLNADIDRNLCMSRWRQGQACEQCSG